MIIFRGFRIPTYFIFDGDAQFKNGNKEEKETKERNHCYFRLAGAALEDFPETQVHETWAMLKEDLEKLVKDDLGEAIFLSIRDQVANQLGYPEPSRVLKNIEGAAQLVECVYNDKKRLPKLEEIIQAITRLCEKSKNIAEAHKKNYRGQA